MKKISIIVPVYKVEPYLRRCIESIINQTYKDLEIILVNDGSPDNCGDICDEYAQLDKRIRVIHKENGGLSDARNAGIDIAVGKYIGFVDSDDYIAEDMYEFLVNLMEKNNADISICGTYYVKDDKIKKSRKVSSEIRLNSETAIKEMLGELSFNTSAWDKLYRRTLFDGIRYPKGKLFEDLFTTYKLLDRANVIVYSSEPKYYYISTQGSIMNSSFSKKKLDDFVEASEEIIEFINSKYPNSKTDAINRYVRYNISFIRQIIESDFNEKTTIERIRNKIKKNLICYLRSQYRLSSKLFAIVLTVNYSLLRILYKSMLKMKRITSV